MGKYVLFGAGYFGREALKEYGKENVVCFWDNDEGKIRQCIDGIRIFPFGECPDDAAECKIIICTRYYPEIITQLERKGWSNFEIYRGIIERKSYYSPKVLIENPYEKNPDRDINEERWIKVNNGRLQKDSINRKVKQYSEQKHLFHHIEIETLNRCNGTCSFCPINCRIDPREKKVMPERLFRKLIDELSGMRYSGRIALFSNNEALLDRRIIEFHRYARRMLPDARMHLYTNGTLLTMEKFLDLLEVLDELIIDNYTQDLSLIPASKMVVDYYNRHPEIIKKVTIVLRKPDEILTSRGGDAPNRNVVNIEKNVSCIHPFQQMIIRPDGKVSLCCNDPLGKCTLGDAAKESLTDIWYGEKYQELRRIIYEGRENFEHCKNCDVFVLD